MNSIFLITRRRSCSWLWEGCWPPVHNWCRGRFGACRLWLCHVLEAESRITYLGAHAGVLQTEV